MGKLNAQLLGWSPFFSQQRPSRDHDTSFTVRVFRQDREAYDTLTRQGRVIRARLGGGLSYRAHDRSELPTVGDWVTVSGDPDALCTVVNLYERKTWLTRQAATKATAPQVIAANVDTVFVVTSANDDFNLRRLERYLVAVRDGGATPVVVINKLDLTDDPDTFIASARAVSGTAQVVGARALEGAVHALSPFLAPGQTVALVGSSGVGKSTIVNQLVGRDVQKTGSIRLDDDAGRHTTVTRELLVLPDSRGLLIDTPGLRELQLWAGDGDARDHFEDVDALAQDCRFRDCDHHVEPGCAVRDALERGQLAAARLQGWRKVQRELDAQRARQDESRRRGKRRR